jgi:hypothetical protein
MFVNSREYHEQHINSNEISSLDKKDIKMKDIYNSNPDKRIINPCQQFYLNNELDYTISGMLTSFVR